MGQSVSISNNNFFLAQGFIDDLPDSSKLVLSLNPYAESLADTASFLAEDVAFNLMPDGYSHTTGWTRLTDADFGYNQGLSSYTGGTNGAIVGDTNWDFGGAMSIGAQHLTISELTTYPNPADRSMVLSFQNQQLGYAKVDLINASGATVMKIFEGNLPTGQQTFDLDVSKLASGLYISRVQIDGNAYLKKFMIQ